MRQARATTAAISCYLLTLSICLAAGPQKIRPITVVVTEEASGKPLAGIIVNYLVLRRTDRTSTLWIFPPIEPLAERTIEVKKTVVTDAQGHARFDDVRVNLREYFFSSKVDRIDSEMLFVNLKPLDRARTRLSSSTEQVDDFDLLYRNLPELPHVMNVNPRYRGHVLVTADIKEAHGREQPLASFSFKPEDFGGKREASFTLPLRRAAQPVASAARPMAANSALVRDACAESLRAGCDAEQRGR